MAKARVLTRSELAEHLGVDKKMVTKWERSGCRSTLEGAAWRLNSVCGMSGRG